MLGGWRQWYKKLGFSFQLIFLVSLAILMVSGVFYYTEVEEASPALY